MNRTNSVSYRQKRPRKIRPLTYLTLLITLLLCMPSAAGLGFTGDVPADFTGTGIFTITDPGGIDVGVPTAAPAGTTSGNDMEDLRLFYDPATDTLYVGMNTYVIAGDVDGDGDPGATSAWLAGITGNDNPDFGGTESFALMLDIDEDGTYDAIAGVSGLADTSGFSVNQHANLFLTPPAGQFAAPLPANTGSLFASPSAGAPDIEFTVLNISALPVSSGSDPDPSSFSVNSFMGSFEDAGIGEDFLPGFPTSIKLASISDFVWEDLNGNGLQDEGEPGIPGVTVNLYDCADNFVTTTTTDATGYYGFTAGPGDYYVEFIAPEGYEFTDQDEGTDDALDNDADPTTGKTVCTTLEPGENDLTWDAGLYRQASVGDFVWDDLDEDGIQDDGEPGIAGVTVNLYECEGTTPLATTATDANGMYLFTGLTPGEYYVEFALPAGYDFSPQDQGADDALDSDADPATGETACTLLESGEADLTLDAGVYLLRANIGDFVWNDLDMDGIQEENEPGIPGVTVNLYECDGTTPIASTSTDANGYYNFEVVPGNYHVEFMLPAGYVFSPQDQGADDTLDSDADPVTGQAACTNLEPGENDPTWDAGIFEAAPAIDIEKATNGEDADEPTGPYIPVGNEVEWTYLVTNTGNVPLENINVVDDQGVTVSCPTDTLAPGESMTCTATGTATVGQYANNGTATGYYDQTEVTDTDPSHYFGAAPAIEIEKSTNGEDADEPTGPYIPVGEPVTWEYVVTNTGNVQLTGIVVTDSQGVEVSCPTDTLAPGESMTCTAEGTATEGQYANLGTVTGYYEDMRVSDKDPSHYFGAAPAIDIEKHTNGFDADEAPGPAIMTGAPVTWEYIVSNTGNVELASVDVYDDVLGYVGTIAVLPVEATETITMDGIAAPGQYENFGNATAVYEDVTVEDTDPSHYFGAAPAIDIEKATNGDDADTPTGPVLDVGDTVTWEYVVTNTGNVLLTDIVVTDDRLGEICTITELMPGENETCNATGTAEVGQYANLGNATGYYENMPVSDEDPSHYYVEPVPAIDIEKSTNGDDADTPTGPVLTVGDTVTWEYVVTNMGNVPLTNIVVTDDRLGEICTIPELMPGDNQTCTATGTAEAGQYANLGNATGYYEDMPVSDEDPSHYFGATPAIDIEKATNGEDADAAPGPMIVAGGTVEWTYVVTNTGNVPLANVAVVDDQGVTVSCPTDTLAPGESMTCNATGTAIPGQYENLGTTTGEYGQTTVSDADPSHYFGAEPAVDIEKHTNGNDADEPTGPFVMVGAPVTWEYIVNNTGNVELTNVEVYDDVLGYVGTIAVLPVGATETLTMDGNATPGQYENFGNATAVYEDV
ncbi:MAG: SdrD B-like domain-containing protein, partial [Methanosarcinaceae archaeon]